MSIYMDASVLVALFIPEARTVDAERIVVAPEPPVVSVLANAEVAATISAKLRNREITDADAETALRSFDVWIAAQAQRVSTRAVDLAAGERLVRRFELQLRAPDAVHIATARRLDADLATFDAGMARAARELGLMVLD